MSELTLITLAYEDDLTLRYQQLSDLPGFVLLESCDRRWGRYDIVSAYPYERVKIRRQKRDLAAALKQFQKKLRTVPSLCPLPFQGGAIGYISYDLAAQLNGICTAPHPILDDMPLLDMGFYDWAIIVDHSTRSAHLMAANDIPETKDIIQDVLNRWNTSQVTCKRFNLQTTFTPLVSQQAYKNAFHAIHQDLQRGRAYQVNYTQPFLAQYHGDAWEMYKRVKYKNPVPFSAFLRLSEGDVLSFSPERFLKMDQGLLRTSPIKGSAQRSDNPQRDKALQEALSSSTKNRAENIMIVDLLRNDLGKIAVPGSVQVKSLCDVQSFASVHHLVSNIEAQCLPSHSLFDAFFACFPGGSITGAPKREAMRIIHEQEAFARGIYCGSIGYFSRHGRFDSNIAIRTVIARQEHLYLSAGGGIVMDSSWAEEHQECYTKIAAIINGL